MSALLIAAISGAFGAATFWMSRRAAARRKALKEREPLAKKPSAAVLEGLPLQLGDVVWVEGDERWLAGGIVAREAGRVYGAVFVSPEGATQKAVAVFPPPVREVFWLSPIEVDCPTEPPGRIEISGMTLSRKGRAPVSLERLGQGAPRVGETALFAVYESADRDVAVILRSPNGTVAWVGKRYDEGEYERLGAGGEG